MKEAHDLNTRNCFRDLG